MKLLRSPEATLATRVESRGGAAPHEKDAPLLNPRLAHAYCRVGGARGVFVLSGYHLLLTALGLAVLLAYWWWQGPIGLSGPGALRCWLALSASLVTVKQKVLPSYHCCHFWHRRLPDTHQRPLSFGVM